MKETLQIVYNKPDDQGTEGPEKINIPSFHEYKTLFEKNLATDPLLIGDQYLTSSKHFLDTNTYLHFLADSENILHIIKGIGGVEESRATRIERAVTRRGKEVRPPREITTIDFSLQDLSFSVLLFTTQQQGKFQNVNGEVQYAEAYDPAGTETSEANSYSGVFIFADRPTSHVILSSDDYAKFYKDKKPQSPLRRSLTVEQVKGEFEIPRGTALSINELFDYISTAQDSDTRLKRLAEYVEVTKRIVKIMERLEDEEVPFFGYSKDDVVVKVREK